MHAFRNDLESMGKGERKLGTVVETGVLEHTAGYDVSAPARNDLSAVNPNAKGQSRHFIPRGSSTVYVLAAVFFELSATPSFMNIQTDLSGYTYIKDIPVTMTKLLARGSEDRFVLSTLDRYLLTIHG